MREATRQGRKRNAGALRRQAAESPALQLSPPARGAEPGDGKGREDLERQIEALSRSEQAARAEARASKLAHDAKDRFLAMLSHELRTPLQPVLSAASVLLRDRRLPPDLLEDVRTIQRNVQLEARLIDDLLDLTRISSGKLALEQSPINLHSVLSRAVEICEPEAMQKRLRLSLELRATRAWVNGDPGRLQQVAWNLIKNAVKFTPEGGQVLVLTRDGDRDGDGDGAPGGSIVISVSDSGVGIAPEALRRIFEPFEQGDDQITRRFGGLGLGLAISRMLIERHGGTICAHSEGAGRGATFTFTLPTTAPPATPVPPRGSYSPQPSTRLLRILLVEDDPATSMVLTKLLAGIGHEVYCAGDCSSALRRAGESPIDLLLCDLGLPDGSGLELVGPITRSTGDPTVPPTIRSIALTGYGAESDVRNSLAAGFDAHLTKPITLEQLVVAINQLFPR